MRFNRIHLLFALAGTLMFGSCVVERHHHHGHGKPMPPGQAKKYYGTKSAKPFAPGQQKKHRH
ncbi:hypothetical protein WJU16_11770 [Chitinophaga pollutisoli]|uniref:Quinol oxidase subunit 4 n=1 Tax=Chitinophaga pollutisoli TaxID=3133966 RepID=A0ABZ2YW78_9BACT